MARPASGQIVERSDARGTTFALRFRAYGQRRYVTLGSSNEGWNRARAETELQNTLADVRRGIWQPPERARNLGDPQPNPTFHEFASDWVERREHEVGPRTVEHWRWALSCHLLPFFKSYELADMRPELVDRYKTAKLRDRERELVERPLSNGSINKTLKVLAQLLDDAVEYGHLESNPARGKRRRLKASRPARTWLEPAEVEPLLKAAGGNRALLALMVLAGLRIGEATALRWRDVDLARSKLHVRSSKTDAGVRTVEVSPGLLDDLKSHRASARFDGPDDFVFATKLGTMRKRSNVARQILKPAIEKANKQLAEADRPTIQTAVTNHSLRRTFASLLYEAGASPAYVMAQMGHTSSALALEVYAKKMERQRDTGAKLDALIRPADWAPEQALTSEVAAPVVAEEDDAKVTLAGL